MKKQLLLAALLSLSALMGVQAQGYFSGDLQLNADFYVRDTAIDATGPHYDNLKSSADSWLSLNYTNNDFGLTAGVRLDLFLNSNLHNPGTVYNGQGIGRWYISKTFNDLKITGGYFYDQFSSGITFRAYEDRALGIDNAILGLHMQYDVNDQIRIKAFGGKQKNLFEVYSPFVKGINLDGYFTNEKGWTFNPGINFVNRTMDQESIDNVVSTIESYPVEERFVPMYNTYVMSYYHTLSKGNVSWFFEGAYKTPEAIYNSEGQLIDTAGNVLYTTLTYSKKGFGATLSLKRTENFTFRTSPNETLLQGMLSFIPPTARQNSLRLPARYNAATQELQETAAALDITFTPAKGYAVNISLSEIHSNDFEDLYFREAYLDVEFKKWKKFKGTLGFQFMQYNKLFYEEEGVEDLTVYTPFVELIYKLDTRKSFKLELQYQNCKEDYGQWLYGSLEYNIAPKWSFAISDMWNFDPNPVEHPDINDRPLHYYSGFMAYNDGPHRFTLAYVRQVGGIVCTGGVCRLEPAFSGVKFGLTSSF